MNTNFPKNLTPKMVEGIEGFNLCTFLIGLEGWRRGLNLKYYLDMNQYTEMQTQKLSRFGRALSLSDGKNIHYFYQSRGDKTSNETVTISNSKFKTNKYLQENNIPMLDSVGFEKYHSNEEIILKAEKIGYPVIIKPTYGSLSKGVILNIQDSQRLKEALQKTRDTLGYKSIILERYFEGEDIRVYVINDEAVAAIRRVPAMVSGDGLNSIEELINQKNKSRENNPYLAARPIKINKETREELARQGYTKQSILEKDKVIKVKRKSTMTQGVDLYDITDTLDVKIKQLAVKTLHSLPNISHGSIDMLYDGKEAFVLEVNSSANISLHLFPTEGEPRNVPAYIVDHYFPDTIDYQNTHQNMYFPYLDIVENLKKNYTNYIEVNPLGLEPYIAKKYIVYGQSLNKRYRNHLRGNAIMKKINGNMRVVDSNTIEVIVASNKIDEIKGFKKLIKKKPKGSKAVIEKVEEIDWDGEINIGFNME